jgi:hypothetical protein
MQYVVIGVIEGNEDFLRKIFGNEVSITFKYDQSIRGRVIELRAELEEEE